MKKCASDMLEIKCEFENGLIKEIKDLKLKLKKCEKKSLQKIYKIKLN